jgi:hypothetical protein
LCGDGDALSVAQSHYGLRLADCSRRQHNRRVPTPPVAPLNQMGRNQLRVLRPATRAKDVFEAGDGGGVRVHELGYSGLLKGRPVGWQWYFRGLVAVD